MFQEPVGQEVGFFYRGINEVSLGLKSGQKNQSLILQDAYHMHGIFFLSFAILPVGPKIPKK